NKMQVVRLCWDEQLFDRGTETWTRAISDCRLQIADLKTAGGSATVGNLRSPIEWVALNAAVNSTANLETKNGELLPVGNSTEGSLLQWLREARIEYAKMRLQFEPLYQIHFSSERKRMTTVIRLGDRLVALSKGAPEWVLQQSTHYLGADGQPQPWT